MALVAENGRWEHAGQRYFAGEVEPCINGVVVAVGAYFGQDVRALVDRLLGEQLADGGWNCEAENGAVVSSFGSTIRVLEGCWRSSGRCAIRRGPPPACAGRSTCWSGGCSGVDGRGDRRRLAPVRLSDLALLRRAAWPGLPARGLGEPNRASAMPLMSSSETGGRRPMAFQRVHVGGASRYGRGRGQTEPLEHPAALRVLDWAGGGGGAVQAAEPPGGRSVIEQIAAREFRQQAGVEDWRVVGDGACTCPDGIVRAGARLVQAIGELPGSGPTSPTSTCGTTADGAARRDRRRLHGHEHRDVELACEIRASRGTRACRRPVGRRVRAARDRALDIPAVMRFWRALLDYEYRPDSPAEDLIDRHWRWPGIWFEQMDVPRPQRNRIHAPVWVPIGRPRPASPRRLRAGGPRNRPVRPDVVGPRRPRGQRADVATS
jgi:hypothetical protein